MAQGDVAMVDVSGGEFAEEALGTGAFRKGDLGVMANKMMKAAEQLELANIEYDKMLVDQKILALKKGTSGLDLCSSAHSHEDYKAASRFIQKAKNSSVKKALDSLSIPQQYETLHELAKMHVAVKLNFKALKIALMSANRAGALKKALNFEPESESKTDRDPEEVEFITDLLEEQKALSDKITELENKRIDLSVELLKAKVEMLDGFKRTQEVRQNNVPSDDDDDEEDSGQDSEEEVLENCGADMEAKILKKRKRLQKEEARLNQIRFLIQKLIGSFPNNAMIFDDATNQLHMDMLLRCGMSPSKLRQDEK